MSSLYCLGKRCAFAVELSVSCAEPWHVALISVMQFKAKHGYAVQCSVVQSKVEQSSAMLCKVKESRAERRIVVQSRAKHCLAA